MTENKKPDQKAAGDLVHEEGADRREFLKKAGTVGAASAVAMLLDASKQASAQVRSDSEACGCGSIL